MKLTKGSRAINALKEAPGLNFVQPRYNINDHQLLLPNLAWSVFFSNTPRVDRCKVCHMAIDNPDPLYANMGSGVSTEPAPKTADGKPAEGIGKEQRQKKVMRSHPRLDLFVADNSKHPAGKFGCTICHGGQPSAVEFSAPRTARRAPNRPAGSYQYGWVAAGT
jgi:hypothetical protein